LTGRLQFVAESSTDLPCVGDWVCARYLDARSHASIHGVLPRKSRLRRKAPGKNIDFQMIAANIDVAFVIQACHFDFNVRRLERYLVMVREGRIEPVVLLTRSISSTSMVGTVDGRIRLAGIDARMFLSNVTGAEAIGFELLTGKTYCLLGSSESGRRRSSTAWQALWTGHETSASRVRTSATTRRQLIVLDGGALLIICPACELGMLGVGKASMMSSPSALRRTVGSSCSPPRTGLRRAGSDRAYRLAERLRFSSSGRSHSRHRMSKAWDRVWPIRIPQ
jgi:ribosome biogenesis GTPase